MFGQGTMVSITRIAVILVFASSLPAAYSVLTSTSKVTSPEDKALKFLGLVALGLVGLSMEALTHAKKKNVLKYHPDKKNEPDEELFNHTLDCVDVLTPLALRNDEKKAKHQQLCAMKKQMHSKYQAYFCEQGDKCPMCTETSTISIGCPGCITHKDWG